MDSQRSDPKLPLTEQDREALNEIFKSVAIEEIKEIEARVAHYSVTPLEPWEETGWIVNSLPSVGEYHSMASQDSGY
jgi:hypothetical protein